MTTLTANPAVPMLAIDPPAPGRPWVAITARDPVSPLPLPTAQLMALFRQHGALLLRGFGINLQTFQQFTAQHCSGSVFNESADRLLLDAEHNIQSVNAGTRAFPLHPELSREPWKPDVCYFACLVPPRALGATTVCDGVALAAALPPALRAALAGRRLRYAQRATPVQLAYWLGTPEPSDAELAAPPPHCPYRFIRIGDVIARYFTRPMLHTPMFHPGPAFGNFLLFARYYNENIGFPRFDDDSIVPDDWLEIIRVTGEALTAAVAWQAGDLLMLDNSRFMHGRTEVLENDGRLIASYFGYLKDAPKNPEEPADPPWRTSHFRPPLAR